MDFVAFWWYVRFLVKKYDASVTSWFRTEQRNKMVGGTSSSVHLNGMAVDVVCDKVSLHEQIASEARYCGLWALVEKDHVHIEVRQKKI